MPERNLALSGNLRYQPKDLTKDFGYDNLATPLVEVELATMDTLADMGVIPAHDYALLTPEIRQQLLMITTTEMDKVEEITKHDIRALVRLMQNILPEPLRRWAHVPLTSFDPLDTARILQFIRTYESVVRPKTLKVIGLFADQARRTNHIAQIGRTHGQHAMPISAGFWFANILNRILFDASKMEEYAGTLVGKISGAVGAYNAQVGLNLIGRGGVDFETLVLKRLGLRPAPISTQILPPEPLAYYLFSALTLSGAIGQFGRDARHLMRSEIAEVGEPFEEDQVGSSTMPHKRNPVTYEGLESAYLKTKNEFGKVLDNVISEHQRDLVGSALSRDFPTIIVNLTTQLNTLLRVDKKTGRTFLERVTIDEEACRRNLALAGDKILAEPIYLSLQNGGYAGDAHEVVNHRAMPLVAANCTLVQAVERLCALDPALAEAWNNIPAATRQLFSNPVGYIGLAREKALEVCDRADAYLNR